MDISNKTILQEKMKRPFLNLVIKGMNGWCYARNPEFDISTWGVGREKVIKNLHELIIKIASINIEKHKARKEVPVHLLTYSKKVLRHKKNIAKLFV